MSLRAQQVGSAGMLAAEKGPPKGTGQGLHLILMSPDLRKIAGATVTVRGLTAKGRVVQALSNQADSSDTARTLNVTFVAGEGKEAAADLWVEGMTAVRTVNLNSVTFVDGSTWKPLAGSSCRVVPDPMMLINGR